MNESDRNLMRDPSIIKGKDGIYHLVWTLGWESKGIIIII